MKLKWRTKLSTKHKTKNGVSNKEYEVWNEEYEVHKEQTRNHEAQRNHKVRSMKKPRSTKYEDTVILTPPPIYDKKVSLILSFQSLFLHIS